MTDHLPSNNESRCALNTDRELFRETAGDYYAPSLHVTAQGAIGINVGGRVFVLTLRRWHELATAALYPVDSPVETAAQSDPQLLSMLGWAYRKLSAFCVGALNVDSALKMDEIKMALEYPMMFEDGSPTETEGKP